MIFRSILATSGGTTTACFRKCHRSISQSTGFGPYLFPWFNPILVVEEALSLSLDLLELRLQSTNYEMVQCHPSHKSYIVSICCSYIYYVVLIVFFH
uniref:Uncharacterized protein n=1 Tax=Nelumbo nucifera TaxID=4432 RepID=A0A822YM52_NELNU|nr:TPA_asm: hypothetical protein HUJ06_011230 [Nelumbo nucifera]